MTNMIKLKNKTRHLVQKLNAKIKPVKYLVIPRPGQLSYSRVLQLSLASLRHGKSRSLITIAAMAGGVAAIVFLVGFAYGLQHIVTSRILKPNSLRLADIQTDSTSVKLDKSLLNKVSKLHHVKDVAPAMSLAASVSFGDSRTEVVVVGAKNAFLDYTHTQVVAGRTFSPEAEKVYVGQTDDLDKLVSEATSSSKVLGATTEFVPKIAQLVDDQAPLQYFRISDGQYLPLKSSPTSDAKVIGYVRGSILEKHPAQLVWGSSYHTSDVYGRVYQDVNGDWYGQWLKTKKLPVYVDLGNGVYQPKTTETGGQAMVSGYLAIDGVSLLSSQDVKLEQTLDKLKKQNQKTKVGAVLGESTSSATTEASSAGVLDETATETIDASDSALATIVTESKAATEAATLKSLISQAKQKNTKSKVEVGVVQVQKPGGKEILISTALAKALGKTPEEILNQTLNVAYIVSGGLIPGLSGRVISPPQEYKIVGVFQDDKRSRIYAPLSDLESMGIKKYSIAKVLVDNQLALPGVREQIESLGLATRSVVDALKQVDRLFRIIKFLLGSFGLIALVVALFGMFNTLTVSLLERTREIGVMKTLGTLDADIMRLFITESLVITLAGSVLGIGLGVVAGYLISFINASHKHTEMVMLFKFPLSFLIGVLLLAVVVGVLVGLYPAKRAKKISALDALRYE